MYIGHGKHVKTLYAHDKVVLAPSEDILQKLIYIYKTEQKKDIILKCPVTKQM
jgi:hypothetical protein